MTGPIRIFEAGPREVRCVEIPPGVEAAYDVMVADRVPPYSAAKLAIAAARDGRDPEAFARHFVELRQAMRA